MIQIPIVNPKGVLTFLVDHCSLLHVRPILNCVHITVKDGVVQLEATNSYKLIRMTYLIEDTTLEHNNIYPREFFEMYAKSLKKNSSTRYLVIDTDRNMIGFKKSKISKVIMYCSSNLEGNYPGLDKLIIYDDEQVVKVTENVWQSFGSRFKHGGYDGYGTIAYETNLVTIDKKMFDTFIKFTQGMSMIMYLKGKIRPVIFTFESMDIQYEVLLLPVRVD